MRSYNTAAFSPGPCRLGRGRGADGRHACGYWSATLVCGSDARHLHHAEAAFVQAPTPMAEDGMPGSGVPGTTVHRAGRRAAVDGWVVVRRADVFAGAPPHSTAVASISTTALYSSSAATWTRAIAAYCLPNSGRGSLSTRSACDGRFPRVSDRVPFDGPARSRASPPSSPEHGYAPPPPRSPREKARR
jgi:hypothetical protein